MGLNASSIPSKNVHGARMPSQRVYDTILAFPQMPPFTEVSDTSISWSLLRTMSELCPCFLISATISLQRWHQISWHASMGVIDQGVTFTWDVQVLDDPLDLTFDLSMSTRGCAARGVREKNGGEVSDKQEFEMLWSACVQKSRWFSQWWQLGAFIRMVAFRMLGD